MDYRLGGYQVLKKWLSYREHEILGRLLRPNEVQHFTLLEIPHAELLLSYVQSPNGHLTQSKR